MELNIVLIRNGATLSGVQGRYVGKLDESLMECERERIKAKQMQGTYPFARLVYTSGMRRCLETAHVAYPQTPAIVMNELDPLDFGDYTGKTYHEITSDKFFSVWAGAGEVMPLKDGEDPHEFHARCIRGFRKITQDMERSRIPVAAVITHRGVIHNILQRFLIPRAYYKDRPIGYGECVNLEYDTRLSAAHLKYSI